MANNPGSFSKRPMATATILKNTTATVTQSKNIIPFYKLLRPGGTTIIQPLKTWLTRA